MTYCKLCNQDKIVSNALGICRECILEDSNVAKNLVQEAHKTARNRFGLPQRAPHSDRSSCVLCGHNCGLEIDGDISYCGLKSSKNGKTISLSSTKKAKLDYYLDPLPCNCCAAWFCPAGTGNGYPEFSYKNGPEYGYYNLSVFFYGCSFDCLYCQNYHHKNLKLSRSVSRLELVRAYKENSRISCVCFFGGSPEPQFPYAITVSRAIIDYAKKSNRIARVCWEWNGYGNKKLVRKAAEISLISGGNIKFDLKAYDPNLHKALTGVDNSKVLENFRLVATEFFDRRPMLPVLNATTLLVPGYITEEEVEKIAEFIASINENIPYSLLGFAPQFEMRDLPYTSRELAYNCLKVAKKYLKNVNIGNKHILL